MRFQTKAKQIRHHTRLAAAVALCLAITLAAAYQPASAEPPSLGSPSFNARDAGQFSAEVPLAWFDLAYALVRDERLSPPVAARTFGYLGVALYEALAPGMPGYRSLAGQLNALEPMPPPADGAYHWPTVANRALATTLQGLLPAGDSATRAAIETLEAQWIGAFQPVLPPGVFRRSVVRGQAVGEAILHWAASDGYAGVHDCPYSPPAGAGLWISTPPGFQPALLPCWGELRPFVLAHGSECNPGPPPAYAEASGSLFYQEALEVYNVVNHLTPEQRTIAQYWADDPGLTGTPPGHSIAILSQILVQQDASLALAAEAYAGVGVALADAFIACWWSKYQYNLLRPNTYIHTVLGDGGWTTPVNTPPFPEYTSGHSVQAGAAAQVLTDLFGAVSFVDQTHVSLGYAPREFASFHAFAEEAAISRLYGGIHYRAAIEQGIIQGHCIGQRVRALQFKIE
jgi:hypothetical protein